MPHSSPVYLFVDDLQDQHIGPFYQPQAGDSVLVFCHANGIPACRKIPLNHIRRVGEPLGAREAERLLGDDQMRFENAETVIPEATASPSNRGIWPSPAPAGTLRWSSCRNP